jgi:hypothetical protein
LADKSSKLKDGLRYIRESALTMLARMNLPRLTGILLRLSVSAAHGPENENAPCRGKVLILSKASFSRDILDVLSTLPDVQAVSMRRSSIKAVSRAFLPSEVGDNYYASASDQAKKAMKRYREFLSRMWPGFDPGGRFRAVVSGNFGYHAEQELAAALEGLGVPFVVLHKENLKTPGRVAYWEKVYREKRGAFPGRRILVYNNIERDLMLRTKVVIPDRVEVVGMPRLDKVHKWRQKNAGVIPSPTVLFFSFLPFTGIPGRYGDNGRQVHLNFSELCSSVHGSMIKLAREHPEIKVMIKTKGRPVDRQSIPGLLGISSLDELPGNLHLIHGGDPFLLMAEAAVVCGFNSTSLLEALAAGRPVVTPWFAEAKNPDFLPFILDLGEAVVKAGTRQELQDLLAKYARKREESAAQLNDQVKTTLRYWLGNDDGKAGERAARVFDSLMKQ